MTDSENFIKFPTGLYTPTIFSILFAHEIARAKRYPAPISLLVMSIISATPISHDLFDEIEIKIAQILNSRLRQSDIPSRNGEEFLILLPNTNEIGSNIVSKRLLETLPVTIVDPHGKPHQVSFNIGSASHPGGPSISAKALRMQASLSPREPLK
jgi:diguanylate cyclase (GGDEF)-like protein